jgi:hypothetical protein
MLGPGRYDDLCTVVREMTDADGAIVLVFGGKRGSGFSCQLPAVLVVDLPKILRHLAQAIEEDKDGFLAKQVKEHG